MRHVIYFFDKVEDHVRGALSHYPIFYSLVGGTGVILFWRGIWHSADYFEQHTFWGSVVFSSGGSILLGLLVLLMTGLFVSVFIGDSIIMSGIRHDKKLIEKSEDEIEDDIQKEEEVLEKIEKDINEIRHSL